MAIIANYSKFTTIKEFTEFTKELILIKDFTNFIN